MDSSNRTFLVTGALLMALSVMAGAFGAHLLRDTLSAREFDVYQTAVTYQIYHSIGLLLVGTIRIRMQYSSLLKWSGRLMATGIVIFSGSLYLLALTGTGWLGAITPLGGLCFIASWILLAVALMLYK